VIESLLGTDNFHDIHWNIDVILSFSWPAMRSPKGEAWWRRRESNLHPIQQIKGFTGSYRMFTE
jgi:hypothetical protein